MPTSLRRRRSCSWRPASARPQSGGATMGIRKNAKFLSATERENLVRAFVLMKADIVNPGAGADEYSRWDEYVAIHRMIQSVNTPDALVVNFGHGGFGAYGFLSWHRYFLYRLELQLQTYVPGVMLP